MMRVFGCERVTLSLSLASNGSFNSDYVLRNAVGFEDGKREEDDERESRHSIITTINK